MRRWRIEAKLLGLNFLLVSGGVALGILALAAAAGDQIDFAAVAFEVGFPLFAAIAAGEWGEDARGTRTSAPSRRRAGPCCPGSRGGTRRPSSRRWPWPACAWRGAGWLRRGRSPRTGSGPAFRRAFSSPRSARGSASAARRSMLPRSPAACCGWRRCWRAACCACGGGMRLPVPALCGRPERDLAAEQGRARRGGRAALGLDRLEVPSAPAALTGAEKSGPPCAGRSAVFFTCAPCAGGGAGRGARGRWRAPSRSGRRALWRWGAPSGC